MTPETDVILWITTIPPFGEAHPDGCCAAFVGDTICGWPRNADGTCGDGHPAQPADAPTHSLRDLLAAVRVREAQLRYRPAAPADTETTP